MVHCRPFDDLMEIWRLLRYCFPGKREGGKRHNTGDVRSLCHFLVYSAEAAEANNKEGKPRIQKCLQKNSLCKAFFPLTPAITKKRNCAPDYSN